MPWTDEPGGRFRQSSRGEPGRCAENDECCDSAPSGHRGISRHRHSSGTSGSGLHFEL